MIKQAVVLAGGKGTRLRERLNGRPKPLVDVAGIPLLARQLEALRLSGFQEALVLVSFESGQIQEFCKTFAPTGFQVRVLDEGAPRGTAGALAGAFEDLRERFLVVYGDTLFDVDLERFWSVHERQDADVTLFLHPNDHPFDSDLVEIDQQGRVTAFHKAPREPTVWLPNLVNAAMYMVEREAIEFWRDQREPTDIARDMFPAMLGRGAKLQGYVSFEYIKDIGTPRRLDKAVAQLRSGFVERARLKSSQKAVFIDRDGTLNQHRDHIARAEDIALIDGAASAIKALNDAEYRTVVITNQPVIARGECDLSEMYRCHNRIETELGQGGAFLDRIYFCPHHPDGGFEGEVPYLKIACECRKPATGMIQQACADLNIDLQQSWFIGDTTTDIMTARRSNLRSILVETGEGGRDEKYPAISDFLARDIGDATSLILRTYPRLAEVIRDFREALEPGAVVLIGGLARQGKSTLASVLKAELVRAGASAEVLRADGFIRDMEQRMPGVAGRFDLAALQRLLQPWLSDRRSIELDVPTYDRLQRRRGRQSVRLSLGAETVLIIEGVPVLALDLETRHPVHRIFVKGDEEARKGRVISDLVKRGMAEGEAMETYRIRASDETPVVESALGHADFVVDLDDVAQ